MNTETTKQFSFIAFQISIGLTFLFITKTMIEQVLPVDGVLWLMITFWIFFVLTLLIYSGHYVYDYFKKSIDKEDEPDFEGKTHFH